MRSFLDEVVDYERRRLADRLEVDSGKLSEMDLLPQVKDRDAYLRSADAEAMQRRAVLYEGFSMSAEEIAAMPLCAHLEIHLDQLERTLRP